ncbi:MAG: hypothetical protein HFE68_00405 [Erysipelotrichaceae bacterium]|nr:hypothetical protein [Erysipelotrichaceae bacterium]MCI9311807.1 hypothetical protein [Erysipelotrichaceae bacterium]
MAAVLFFAGLAGIYALLYYLNHKTPLPEGCENIKAECEGCHDSSCALHPSHDQ